MCDHQEFKATVEVNRMIDTARFMADVTIWCAQCGVPMKFRGLPMGLDMSGAAVSPDGTEARLAIFPANEPIPDSDLPPGFRIIHDEPRSGSEFR